MQCLTPDISANSQLSVASTLILCVTDLDWMPAINKQCRYNNSRGPSNVHYNDIDTGNRIDVNSTANDSVEVPHYLLSKNVKRITQNTITGTATSSDTFMAARNMAKIG